jgi:L-seryl-tRNA(Ser) seleniumtransferase
MSPNPLRNIPSVNELLESPPLRKLVDRLSHNVVVGGIRSFLDEMRHQVQNAAAEVAPASVAELAERVARRILETEPPPLRAVINATGILLHTGLGRAPLAEEAIREMAAVARDYANVETDLATGQRSRRTLMVEGLLRELTGAEAGFVVNNNAGATMLALAALASGKEVVVSRGQLIEIGGSYRLPDVMAASGAVLREVGTTNKTRIEDYDRAIGEQTAALMLVHPSNFVVVGFVEGTGLAELVELGHRRKLPVIHDIGSGALIDFARFGFSGEPVAGQSIKQGADLILFSGDKLLGGPQCGIILGRRALIERIEKHPMARALRVDKLTLASLAATLRLYRDPQKALHAVPILQLLGTSVENLKNRAERLAPQIAVATSVVSGAEAVSSVGYLGGGTIPSQELATWCIALQPAGRSVDQLAAALRQGTPSVVGRVQQDRLLLDLRSVLPRQDQDLVTAVAALGTQKGDG